MKKVLFWYMALLLTGFGSYMFYLNATAFYEFYIDKNYWGGVAEGKMLEVSFHINTSCSTSGPIGSRSCSSSFHPDTKYEYFVDSKHYVGSAFWYGAVPTLHSEQEVLDTVKTVGDVGDTITVYYHPENPEESVLIKDQITSNYLISLMISLAMYAGVYALWRWWL